MKTMNNNIVFIPTTKEVQSIVDPPKPAKLCIPKWFKDIPAVNEKNVEISFNGMPDTNLKNCMPFFDSLVSGYIQETWSDIVVQKDKDVDITYNQSSSMSPTIMNHREKTHMPIANNFYDFEFVWNQVWIPKLPDGYSYLFLNPLNRVDLPFYTSSAIVDADKVNYSTQGSIPFYIKNKRAHEVILYDNSGEKYNANFKVYVDGAVKREGNEKTRMNMGILQRTESIGGRRKRGRRGKTRKLKKRRKTIRK